jgi:hypothetical protein
MYVYERKKGVRALYGGSLHLCTFVLQKQLHTTTLKLSGGQRHSYSVTKLRSQLRSGIKIKLEFFNKKITVIARKVFIFQLFLT